MLAPQCERPGKSAPGGLTQLLTHTHTVWPQSHLSKSLLLLATSQRDARERHGGNISSEELLLCCVHCAVCLPGWGMGWKLVPTATLIFPSHRLNAAPDGRFFSLENIRWCDFIHLLKLKKCLTPDFLLGGRVVPTRMWSWHWLRSVTWPTTTTHHKINQAVYGCHCCLLQPPEEQHLRSVPGCF